MPNDEAARSSLEEIPLSLPAARVRLERYVAHLAHDKGVVITVMEFEKHHPAFEGGPDMYVVSLRSVGIATAVRVDHYVLAGSDEFFDTFVSPRLCAAIDMLASYQGLA